jgi:signal transduction histidine kinase
LVAAAVAAVHRSLAAALAAVTSLSAAAQAQTDSRFSLGMNYADAARNFDDHELAGLALFLGVVFFAVVTAVMLVRTRERLRLAQDRARAETAAFEGEIDRLCSLFFAEPQLIVVWDAEGAPELIGDPTIIAPGLAADHVLTYSAWLRPEQALLLESAVERLLKQGEGFAITFATATGRYMTAEGRAIGGRAVLRLSEVTGLKKEIAELGLHLNQLRAEREAERALIEALPSPVWVRDAGGRLTFANAAYAQAVQAADGASAVAAERELLDDGTRAESAKSRAGGAVFSSRVPALVGGARHAFDVLEVPTPRGSAGIARDATAAETLRAEIARTVESHRRILDELATGVAMFRPDHTLSFYNSAYQSLWDLDAAFLDQRPTDSAVLDRLRAARRLPEQPDFRAWKVRLHQAYGATKPTIHEWHLPDQRALRVVTAPDPDGGVTYLFDDVTERLNLERRFDALIRVQRETLDNLSEGVALFGSDGRVRLFNPAFAGMWQLSPVMLKERPHVEAVIEKCRSLHRDEATWQALRAEVTTLERREPMLRRIERTDGTVVDCRTTRMPDAGTLVTFQDVTDSVNVERALIERNEALVEADEIKIDFVHHVSYELRSPLTNIIGFAHLLGDPATGLLTPQQAEYLGYINISSNTLLAIINNILDLASIVAGAMTLNLEPVDIRAAMDAAAEGVQDRCVKNTIRLDLVAPDDIGSFIADERRLRQILFNLLSNAVGFSPPGETVTLAAARTPEAVTFSVSDRGPGISDEIKHRVFELFETHSQGTRHRGAGLGLSIVRSFVELHRGTVRIDSVRGRGTTVICTFPLADQAAPTATE